MRRMLFCTAALLACVLATAETSAQWVRYHMERGNGAYNDKEFDEAERHYRETLLKEPELPQPPFNIGNSLFRRERYDESIREFGAAAEKSTDPAQKASSLYNTGNAHLKAGRYQDAVASYARSLRLRPDDQDAKYNLSYALEKLRQQQQQDRKDQQKQDQQKQDQQNKDQQKQDQQEQQDRPQDQQQPRQQQQQKQLAQAEAERILDVLKNSEKEVQKKLRKRPAARVRVEKDW